MQNLNKPSESPSSSSDLLGDLGVGAVVFLHRGHNNLPTVAKIDRVTKTKIIIGNEEFRRKSGHKIGRDRWNFTRIEVPKPGEVERIRAETKRQNLAWQVSKTEWNTLPLETLEQVAAAVGGVGKS